MTRILSALLFGGITLCLATEPAAASTQSAAEARGFRNCVDAAETRSRSLVVQRPYFVNEGPDTRNYYVNGVAAVNGAWKPVRVACETSSAGHRLLAVRVEQGSYRARPSATAGGH